eukprot:m.41430 g.41430  ORF g.41430 m.41430 type:complete len:148 (-) comp46154_c0_seq4:180-623(-)
MSAVLARSTFRALRSAMAVRTVSISAALRGGGHALPGDPKDNPTGLGVSGVIPSELDQATGRERAELLEHLKGNTDPFGMAGYKVGPWGTKENPRKVPSHLDSRIVGCVCEPEAERIYWFEVKAGENAVCPCGQYFCLTKATSEISH